MKKGLATTGILVGVGLFGYAIYKYFANQVSLLKEFGWKVLDFNITDIDLQVIKGNITFRFSSIADLELIVSQFYLDFEMNGKRVGYLEDLRTFIIPAKGYSDITFQYTLNPQYIIKDAVDIILFSTKNSDAVITFDGYAKVSSGFIKATIPVKCDCSVKNLDCDCK